MSTPKTDDDFIRELALFGHEVVDGGGVFVLVNKTLGGQTILEADNLSDALFEAWCLVKD